MAERPEQGHVLATCNDEVVYCRIIGIGNMNNCAAFQNFSLRMRDQGYREFVLDFSHCEGLDSTFLGILLGIVVGDKSSQAHVVLVNASESIRRVLQEVGIDRLLDVCEDNLDLPDIPMRRVDRVERSTQDQIGMILRAHENLIRISGSNRERFGRFLEMLRKEIEARQRNAGGGMEPNSRSGS